MVGVASATATVNVFVVHLYAASTAAAPSAGATRLVNRALAAGEVSTTTTTRPPAWWQPQAQVNLRPRRRWRSTAHAQVSVTQPLTYSAAAAPWMVVIVDEGDFCAVTLRAGAGGSFALDPASSYTNQ
ncbi:uncharacterized protein ACA1_293930 [Acanthamoeba castellanii str. Neff]|uniref:Secreted protein n=1 Tax=Acanthamoeba castellanii (strain ATCC 30010 / Neff) TaxID=1257118 RepID=L8HJN6_ACACF|nr:uncharacterized protein ACA1_293930 [Acanthamoeba castellanii str. Neff]ELR25422.1 hypothetical protein ACA1_293930 [Acanthamoeba castellanii str. Neff]